MRTATVRQLRNAFPAVLRLIRNGETVAITSRRQVVANLTPPAAAKLPGRTRRWPDLAGRLATLRQQPMLPVSGAELLAQERERY